MDQKPADASETRRARDNEGSGFRLGNRVLFVVLAVGMGGQLLLSLLQVAGWFNRCFLS